MNRRLRTLIAVLSVIAATWTLSVASRKVLAFLFPLDHAAFAASYVPSIRIYDRSGILLREKVNPSGERANRMELGSYSPNLVQAVLSAEDSGFRRHGAVDWFAVARALASNIRGKRTVSGASTITMQLARLAFGADRDFRGKVLQTLDAMRLELAFPKDRILEEYMNRAPFAPGCTGAEAASFRYFGKSSAALETHEAALLAGMIQAPSLFDPIDNPEAALKRRNWVLERMRKTGKISATECRSAQQRPLPRVREREIVRAGHFTDYVLSLSPEAGDVHTTLDWALQENAEQYLTEYVRRNKAEGLTNAAAVILDNATGNILCMVGSRDWAEAGDGSVNGATSLRQPGSTLKPFIYALAFDNGRSPATMLADIETEYVNDENTLYIPRNYSRTWRGPVLAKEALGTSLNIPAIRLARDVGLRECLGALRLFGFSSLKQEASHYGLALVLGNGEVTLLELAGAYAALARGGQVLEPSPFDTAREGHRAVSESSAFLITSILSDETMRVQAFGSNSPLLVGYPIALKTGTSSNWRDSWTVGYTSEFTIAVWCGDFGSVSMNQLTGSTGAGPAFAYLSTVMADRLGRMPSLPPPPKGIVKCLVCAESGMIPHEFCPRKLVVSLADTSPTETCTMHYQARIDTRTGDIAGKDTPTKFTVTRLAYDLGDEFAEWLKTSGKFSPRRENGVPAKALAGPVRIDGPREGDVYIIEPGYNLKTQTIALSAVCSGRPDHVDWYIDGRYYARALWPYGSSWLLQKGKHTVKASDGRTESQEVAFEVR
jgi:penicillin-binding protein 1C